MGLVDPKLKEILSRLGIDLEERQPHIGGEREFMSPEKLVLVGRMERARRVVIKASNTPKGRAEIEQEKKARDLLKEIPFAFANDTLLMPHEIYFKAATYFSPYTIFVTEFIEQEKVFVAHSLEEQFFLVLRAFEAQEAFHATTYEHVRKVKNTFATTSPEEYVSALSKYPRAQEFLRTHKNVLSRYSGHLTHTDFVPHNLRVHERTVYVLDQTAIAFANKYEGWARFLNYMALHNPDLEHSLKDYIRKNRGEDEYLDLRLMRVYKAAFLISYYERILPDTEGDLHELTQDRVAFWTQVLDALLEDREIPADMLSAYKEQRDHLRSKEEKERQREFAEA